MIFRYLLALLLLCVSGAVAAYDPPDNFRGIKWGDSAISTTEQFDLLVRDGDLIIYTRRGDKLNIGEAKLSSISYGFYKDRFFSVMLEFRDSSNFRPLFDTLAQRYGAPSQPNQFMQTYIWGGYPRASVIMQLKYSEISQKGSLFYSYRPITDELNNDSKIKSRDAAKDL